MSDNVPRRGDGFDPPGSVPNNNQGLGASGPSVPASGMTVKALQGMSIVQIMDSLNVDQDKAQLIKDFAAGAPAGILAGLAVHYLGPIIGETWAGGVGGLIGGLLGGTGAAKINIKKYPRKRRY